MECRGSDYGAVRLAGSLHSPDQVDKLLNGMTSTWGRYSALMNDLECRPRIPSVFPSLDSTLLKILGCITCKADIMILHWEDLSTRIALQLPVNWTFSDIICLHTVRMIQ